MALAVAAVILIGGGAGQDRQSTAQNEPAGQPPQPTTEEAEQPPTEPQSEEQASQGEGQALEDPGENETLGSPALGDEGAPVVMVEYSDYQ